VKILKPFLDKNVFANLKSKILADTVPWYCINSVTFNNDNKVSKANTSKFDLTNFYYIHVVYEQHAPRSTLFEFFEPVLKALDAHSLLRIKINMYPRTESVHEHLPHFDYIYSNKACIIYLNSCDGYTKINDNIVNSVENTAVVFDGSTVHNSTTCTNDRFRLTINLNYY